MDISLRRLEIRDWKLRLTISNLPISNLSNKEVILLQVLSGRLQRTTQHALSLHRERLNTLTARLATLNPAATLARGYAIVQKEETVVTCTNQVARGEALVVKVSDGEFGVMVKGERDGEE